MPFHNIHRETPVLESVFNRVAGIKAWTLVFSCEYGEIFKNNYLEERLRTAASASSCMQIQLVVLR